jgi:natural product precursor
MENKMKKLSLKKVTLVELDNSQMKNVKGGSEENGILSIGHECSAENSCKRVSSVETCYCCYSSRNWCQAMA